MKNINKVYPFVLFGFLHSYIFLVGGIYFLFFNSETMMNKFTFLYYVGFSLIQGLGLSLIFYLLEKKRKKKSLEKSD